MRLLRTVRLQLLLTAALLHAPTASAQQATPRPTDSNRVYQIFLLGNTGAASPADTRPTLALLRAELQAAGAQSAVVFAGDLLPCCGLPDSGAVDRVTVERHLDALIDLVRDYEGRVFFVPGEREWGRDKDVGWMAVLRVEEYVENALGRGNVFLPDAGFPGPETEKLADDLRLVALNTQWLLTDKEKATGDAGDYDAEEDDDVYSELEDLIAKRSTETLIVVGHHPLYSNGRYGGHYPPKAHLFPLTMGWDDGYIPLPIIGTLAVTLRRNIGNEQHLSNERNARMRRSLDRLLLDHDDFIYVSAHDYSLQLFESTSLDDMQKYVVTGSAAKAEHVSGGRDSEFVARERGFVSLHFYNDASVWFEVWAADDDGTGRRIYETPLRDPGEIPAGTVISTAGPFPDYSDSSLVVAAEPEYDAGWLHGFLAGTNHRDAWVTPVEVPYLDLGKEHGGLTPLKRGGGMQTTSIRLAAPDGNQYVLRSVNKDGKRYLPEEIQETFVAPISQDFLSYSHPYGAFIVPTIADAVGVYHTNPKLVYVPADPRLGIYQDLVGDMLVLYEERPNKDMSHAPSFGRSADVVGAPEMYRRVTRDNDFRVDARALARARLLDMWMSDWDRHKDQWRWASFDAPSGNGKIYRPIPRDRDQAFNRLNFFLHPLIKPFMKFQDYRKSYGSLKGLTQNGRRQDHRFLSVLSLDDWVSIADSMQRELTDDVIERAFRQWPEPIFALHGEEMIEIGKVRRNKLRETAEMFYRLHARTVDVVGTNKHERFEVRHLNDDQTEIVMFKTSKEGEIDRQLYRRVINRGETGEVVLYGLGGDDRFVITGNVQRSVLVRAVGGTGDDSLVDSSNVARGGKRTRFYDSQASAVTAGPETAVMISDDPRDNEYTEFFEYERTYPFGAGWYNVDDGFVFMGGALRKEHAFRREPFGRLHRLSGSFATTTNALRFNYAGTFKEAVGDWDVGLNLGFRNAENIRNFYGLGNETDEVASVDAVRIRLGEFDARIPFSYVDETGWRVEITPKLTTTNVRDDQTQLQDLIQPGLASFTTDAQWYAGVRLAFDIQYVDDRDNPRRGFRWNNSVDGNLGFHNAPDDFVTVASDLAFYASPATRRQVTLAFRFGGAHTFGTVPFYASNALGGTTNLRGHRGMRFSGRSSLFANSEARVELLDIGGDVLPGTVGLVGFFDVGRVWTDGEASNTWHPGYGGGVWYNVVGELILRLTMGWSPDDRTTLFGAGFFY